jgi:N6-adenosine-specific RNA methylase IME4
VSATAAAGELIEFRPPGELRAHAYELVPPLALIAREALKADVRKRGIVQPLEINKKGVVLNGRERLAIATELALAHVPVRLVNPSDEVEHIILGALQRRHLTASQRAALALELDSYQQLRADADTRRRHNLRQHADGAASPPRGKTRDHVAAWAGVSPRTVQDAATVQQHDPGLFEQIKNGQRHVEQAASQVRRALRDANMPAAPPLPDGPFELIYADPPWQLGNPDGRHAPDQHYPTMPLDEIKQLRPPVSENAVLFLWAVNCLLPQAIEVITAWGFTYKTNLVWVKPSVGLGYWTRNRHELLLFATRGHIDIPEPQQRPDSVIEAKRGRHSQKPAAAYELIEQAYPRLSKLELFARGAPRPGWQAWGNQTQAE